MANNIDVLDAASATKTMKTTDNAGVHTAHHNVDSSALPTGASTAAKQPALGTAGTASTDVITVQGIAAMTALKVDGSGVTQPVSASALPLPTGAATSALQTQPGVDIGDVTINNAAGAAAVNVQDGGNSITVDGTVTIGTSVTPGTGATNLGKSEDAVHADGDVGVFVLAVRQDTIGATAGTTGDYSMLQTNNQGSLRTSIEAGGAAVSSGAGSDANALRVQLGNASAVAHDAVVATNPVAVAGVGSTAVPSAVSADGDQTRIWVDRNGAQIQATRPVTSGGPANVSASATSVTLLASNTGRKGFTIWNDSSAILYVKFGATASTTSCHVKLVADAYYESPAGFLYTGVIDGIWASATGAARVGEFT